MDFLNRINELQDITLYYYTFLIFKKKKNENARSSLNTGFGVSVMGWIER